MFATPVSPSTAWSLALPNPSRSLCSPRPRATERRPGKSGSRSDSFGGVAVGHFLAEDLAEVRQRLHAEGHVVKVSLTHKCEPRKLTYAPPKWKMVIHKEHADSVDIAAFLRKFSLPYHGSALPAAVGQVME